jgi:hypothetical protein
MVHVWTYAKARTFQATTMDAIHQMALWWTMWSTPFLKGDISSSYWECVTARGYSRFHRVFKSDNKALCWCQCSLYIVPWWCCLFSNAWGLNFECESISIIFIHDLDVRGFHVIFSALEAYKAVHDDLWTPVGSWCLKIMSLIHL